MRRLDGYEPDDRGVHRDPDGLVRTVAAKSGDRDTTERFACDAINARYGNVKAVTDVTVSVAGGEIRGIIGPNGAGKSSMFDVVTGHLSAGGGRILLDGVRVEHKPAWERARLGIARTFQTPKVVRDLSVRENCYSYSAVRAAQGRGARALGRWIDEALDAVGIVEKATHVASELTLPELKRLEFARAIAAGPRVLLLDEVMAGLRSEEQDGFLSVIRTIASSGCAVLMVEHVMRVMRSIADIVTVVADGAVLLTGGADEVLDDDHVAEVYMGTGAAR